jgi:hypothetical protein
MSRIGIGTCCCKTSCQNGAAGLHKRDDNKQPFALVALTAHTALGANAVASANGAIAIGASQSTGVNSIAIGTGAVATGSIAVGFNASAANGGAAFGDNTVATGSNSVAVGGWLLYVTVGCLEFEPAETGLRG